MIKVGLTGGIGSGKTFIADIFQQLAVPVFNADKVAKDLYDNPAVRSAVISAFGEEIYGSSGIKTEQLAQVVFNDHNKLELLNRIIHPAVEEEFMNYCHKHSGSQLILKEAAILFETGAYKKLDATILVTASESSRISRVMKRDGSEEAQVLDRMRNQWIDEKKVPLADYILNNNEQELILPQVIDLYNKLIVRESGNKGARE